MNTPRKNTHPPKTTAEPKRTKDFYNIMITSIDESFYTLGEGIAKSIYFHLENKFGIKKHEIPLRINDFSSALEKIFGIGAQNLESMFMKSLYSKIALACRWPERKWENPEITFPKYVQQMKLKFNKLNMNKTKTEVYMNAGKKH
jgi:hypothetical protein